MVHPGRLLKYNINQGIDIFPGSCYQEACEITAYLCKLYNIDPHGTVTVNGVKIPTILCHQDSYKLGFGGNHSDIYNWFPKFGKSMDDVRNDVAALMKGSSAPVTNETAVNYQVEVTADDGLNCRTTYSTSGSIVTTYPKGTVLTITKESNNWGYTGKGWVSLAYTKKIETNTKMEDDEMLTYNQFKTYMDQYRKELQDNDSGEWSQKARQFCVDNGIFSGAGTDAEGNLNYMWEDLLTREQCAQVLYAFAQKFGLAPGQQHLLIIMQNIVQTPNYYSFILPH